MARRSLVPPLLLPLLGACALSSARPDPWAALEAGTWGVGVRPALFTLYDIDGTFVSKNFAPPPDEITSHDSGSIVGRFGLALEGQYYLSDRVVVALGVDGRSYDIEDLTPTPELPTEVDRIDSLQYYASLRYIGRPGSPEDRLRPFAQIGVAWLPGVDVGFEVDLSGYGSSNLQIETEGEGYWVGGTSLGVLYSWRDRWMVEAGLLYEFPITSLEVDLSFDIGPTHFPLTAEFEPAGLVGFCGVSYLF